MFSLHFTDHLLDRLELIEPWREVDALITSFCSCSLELSGACSPKQRSLARRCRSADPGDGPGPKSSIVGLRRSQS